MTSATAFAPATVSNVACGFDVLGFPIEEPGDFFLGEDGRQSWGFVDVEQALQQVCPVERGSEEESKRRHVRIDAGGAERAPH